jgi:hypothetical protein
LIEAFSPKKSYIHAIGFIKVDDKFGERGGWGRNQVSKTKIDVSLSTK